MKIVFFCGSLEPGFDGVGDYSRRLCGELIRQGADVNIISLNERNLEETYVVETQESEGTSICVLRLSNTISYNDRFILALEKINQFNPEWLSLQYVPFSFQNKGLPLCLGKELKKIGKGRKWHIMFHELWVGMADKSPNKLIVWGWMQKMIILSLIKKLNPCLINTQCLIYQSQLNKLRIKAEYLPLFGNIPYDRRYVASKEVIQINSDTISFVVFGTIHSNAPINEFAKEVALYAAEKNVQISLNFIGRSGRELKNWVAECESVGLGVELWGEQGADFISRILSRASIGITTTPYALIDKSGTVAAMLEHGIKVICLSSSWQSKESKKMVMNLSGIMEYQNGNLERCIESFPFISPVNTVSEIGKKFITKLLNRLSNESEII